MWYVDSVDFLVGKKGADLTTFEQHKKGTDLTKKRCRFDNKPLVSTQPIRVVFICCVYFTLIMKLPTSNLQLIGWDKSSRIC